MITSPPLIRIATRLLRVTPVGPMRAIAFVIGLGASHFLRARRRTVLTSLRFLRPDLDDRERDRMASRTFANLAAASVDLFRLPSASREELEQLVAFDGLEHVDAALAKGTGVIIASAHLGPYELGGACLTAKGYRTYAVAEDLDPAVYDALASFRESTGMQLINQRRAATGTYAALKENAIVLLVADRVVGKKMSGVDVPFAAGVRALPVGPAAFAAATGAPIVIGHIHRASRPAVARYVVRFDAPLEAASNTPDERISLTRRLGERLSRIVAEHADEWFVFQPDWRNASE